MDLGHSTAPPPLAHGSRGEEHDSRRQDFLDYMASMDLMGTPVEERVNVFGEFVEIQSRIARDPSTRTPWPIRRLGEYGCTSAPPQDDSLVDDHDFDDEDTTRRCEEAAYCRAALESHAGIDPSPDPGVAEGGSAPLSKEEKTVVMVVYGYTGMTTVRVPPEAVKNFNTMVGRVVSDLDERYDGRIICMGDFNSLADVSSDGMGLINGVRPCVV